MQGGTEDRSLGVARKLGGGGVMDIKEMLISLMMVVCRWYIYTLKLTKLSILNTSTLV